jgi:hypothetical protein
MIDEVIPQPEHSKPKKVFHRHGIRKSIPESNFSNTDKTKYNTTKTTIIFSLKKEKTFIKLL